MSRSYLSIVRDTFLKPKLKIIDKFMFLVKLYKTG